MPRTKNNLDTTHYHGVITLPTFQSISHESPIFLQRKSRLLLYRVHQTYSHLPPSHLTTYHRHSLLPTRYRSSKKQTFFSFLSEISITFRCSWFSGYITRWQLPKQRIDLCAKLITADIISTAQCIMGTFFVWSINLIRFLSQ